MNEFKFQVVNFLLLGVLVFGMYWAFTHINNGVTYGSRDLIQDIAVDTGTQEVDDTIFDTPTDTSAGLDISYEVSESDNVNVTTANKSLISELEGLIDDKIYMKNGSRGTRVGTVQKFLNIYLEKNATVDGDYGPGTVSNVKKFQADQGLTADGQAGPATYQKMIEVLKS